MAWKVVFLMCLALATAAPQSELKRRAMEQALEEIMEAMEARKSERESFDDELSSGMEADPFAAVMRHQARDVDDGEGSGVGEQDSYELRRFAEQELASSIKAAREAARTQDKKQMSPPHVFYFLIDDMGYNDIGWNNPEIISPNIDALASSGIILDQSYAQAVCSPSRGSFMTGLYPIHNGMQHDVILFTSPECGPADIPYLPEKLRDLGYANHMVGKWHLGFCRESCTPPERGFDTFYGFYQGYTSHYNHMVGTIEEYGYDWHDQSGNDISANGTYSSDLLTDRAIELIQNHDGSQPMFMYFSHSMIHTPTEVPAEYLAMYDGLPYDEHRRRIMAMVSVLDDSIANVVQAIKDAGLYDNSLIIFQSDNGGETAAGSNIPFRGAKASIYEGGMRTPAFMHSPLSEASGLVSDELFHISDWHATILSMAGGDISGLDGVDQSPLLRYGGEGNRDEIVYTIDEVYPQFLGTAGIRIGDYKLLKGYPGIWDGWEEDGTLGFTHELDYLRNGYRKRGEYNFDYPAMAAYIAQVADVYQLFNLKDDPEERVNLASSMPDKVAELEQRINDLRQNLHEVDLSVQVDEPAGNPSNFGGFWEPGWC